MQYTSFDTQDPAAEHSLAPAASSESPQTAIVVVVLWLKNFVKHVACVYNA